MRKSATCSSFVWRATLCRQKSGAASNTRAPTSRRNCSWCSDTKGAGQCRRRSQPKFQGVQERSRIQLLLENILPGLDEVEPQLPPQQKLERAVESNVRWSMRQILETPEGRARMAEGRMKLVGAVCEIATGQVRLLA